jgi:hypothetical protein
MNIHDEVNQLRNQAIALLLNERQKIDNELTALGYGKENPGAKRRGRKPKGLSEPSQPGSSE